MTAIAVGSGIYTAVTAKQQADDAAALALTKEEALTDLENNRQDVVNPYANISNQYANLGVATQAAKFQSEESDKALANTLDTLRAGGFSAGGATALAQAAMKGKQAVSASIESQEAQNQKLKAQGASEQQKLVMQEKQRVQGAMANAEQFRFGQQELREGQAMDRMQALSDQDKADQIEQEGLAAEAKADAFGSATDAATSYYNTQNPVPLD